MQLENGVTTHHLNSICDYSSLQAKDIFYKIGEKHFELNFSVAFKLHAHFLLQQMAASDELLLLLLGRLLLWLLHGKPRNLSAADNSDNRLEC